MFMGKQLQAWALIKFTADKTVSSYFISSSDDDKYSGTYRICLKTLFEIMWPDIYRSSILFYLRGRGRRSRWRYVLPFIYLYPCVCRQQRL